MVNGQEIIEEKIHEAPFEFDSEDDELAFKEQLSVWREEFGKVYTLEVNDVSFFFRLLTKNEMDTAREMYTDDYDRTEHICRVCVIEPIIEDYSLDIYAGVPEVLCGSILEESGYVGGEKVKNMIASWESKMEQVENQLPLIIKEAFSDIPIETIESWPLDKIAEYYVKAKWLLANLRGIELVSDDTER